MRSLSKQHGQLFLLLASLFLATLMLSLRSTQAVGTDFLHPSLWAEDGNVFVNEAGQLGIGSIVKPYAGYMHLIPRIAAFGSNFIPLAYVPIFFHLVWFLAFLAFVYIVHTRLAGIGANGIVLLWTMALIVAQPQAGEVFFTTTNIQWFTGLALLVFLIFPFGNKTTAGHLAFVFMAGLTGPFCILALPILALRFVLLRDFKRHKAVYIAILACAAIQLSFQIASPKIFLSNAPTLDAGAWFSALVRFLGFGNEYHLGTLFSYVFWASIPFALILSAVFSARKGGKGYDIPCICAFLALAVALVFMGAGFLRDDINAMGPVISRNGTAGGSRYYLIPYTMVLIAAVLSTMRNPVRAGLALGAFSIICYANFVKPDRVDLQWDAYSRLSKSVPDLLIPIAPTIGSYPGWFVSTAGRRDGSSDLNRIFTVPLDSVGLYNGKLDNDGKSQFIKSESDNLLLQLKPDDYCDDNDSLGLEISADRGFDGWIHVLWARDGNFNDKNSVLRYYPKGPVTAYFAFQPDGRQDAIRIRPSFVNGGATKITGLRIFCLR